MLEAVEIDLGADGEAATSRPHRTVVVLGDARSAFHDVGVAVQRYATSQLDQLRERSLLTFDQYGAACHATALFRAAGLSPNVTSRYEEWVSGGRGQWVSTDSAEDEAAPWRSLLDSLPAGPARALEAAVMSTMRMDDLQRLQEALDRMRELEQDPEEI